MLVAIYQFCLWMVVVTAGTLLYCAVKILWEYKVKSRYSHLAQQCVEQKPHRDIFSHGGEDESL